ncbi:MAG: DUF4065 domain-containing protein [Ruminococcus sp.]|nr:DUF4065 domain-containing protein [Ruminococcus sp.]
MEKKYNIIDIAKWFVNELHPEPLKLQQLLYLAQGISYAFNDKPLFEESIEAWEEGPIIPSIYYKYKIYGHNPIPVTYNLNTSLDDIIEILNYVKDNYSFYDSAALKELIINQEPWLLSQASLSNEETISKENIANYFRNII